MKKILTSVILVTAMVMASLLAGCSKQPEGISIEGGPELEVGATLALAWTVLPEDAADKTVTFSSSATAVATVDESGIVYGVAKGTATITASTVNGLETEVQVEVILPVDHITSAASLTLNVEETADVDAQVVPSDASDPTLEYASEDEAIATVDTDGLVTAVSPGETTITITSPGGKVAQTRVTVELPISEVILDQAELYIHLNGTIQLEAAYLPEDATRAVISWESSDTSIATVDEEGNVTGVALGSASISATADSGVTAVCEVTVIKQSSGGSGSGSGGSGGSGSPGGTVGNGAAGGGSAGSGDGGGGSIDDGGASGGGAADIPVSKIDEAVSWAIGYAQGYGFTIVGDAQPNHGIGSTAYTDYDAFIRNLTGNVDAVAAMFTAEERPLVKVCIYRSDRTIYVSYG